MGTSVLHSEFWRMMYLLTILLAASAFAVDLDRRMRFPEPEGICMDVGTMNALCVKDSPVADRFHAAAKDCFGGDEEASARRMGGRRNRTCLSFDKLLEKIDEDFQEDACFYTHLGWLNETGGINNATIYEDVSSLDSRLLQGISEQMTRSRCWVSWLPGSQASNASSMSSTKPAATSSRIPTLPPLWQTPLGPAAPPLPGGDRNFRMGITYEMKTL